MILKKYYIKKNKMNNLNKTFLLLLFAFIITKSEANTLTDSLNSAYLNNTKLNAERANMQASKEDKRGAVSEFLPSVTISGYVSDQDNTGGVNDTNFKPSEQSLKIEQKIFQSGGGIANFMKKKHGQTLGEYTLKKTEQETLLDAAKAHTELLLNIKKVNINLINVDLLERQVENDQNRLEKGEINLTDLSQSESSLSGARAKLITVQNDLVTSKTNFEKIIGKKPSDNIGETNGTNLALPTSLANAYKISKLENPELQIATFEFEQAKMDVIIAGSDLAPSATVSYEIAEQDDVSATIKDRTQQTVKATATWPLFSGGSNIFSLRKSQQLRNQKKLLLEDSIKQTQSNVANSWSKYQSSMSLLDSIRSQVKAAEIANEGITLEYETGGTNRTTLEVIQSRSILLEARISLAEAERDFLISQFNLLSSVGHLTAKHLKLEQ
tara:strand:- start:853 stop:2175 length:1323 start_codon:yes stop_codon:yes gene_type:complete